MNKQDTTLEWVFLVLYLIHALLQGFQEWKYTGEDAFRHVDTSDSTPVNFPQLLYKLYYTYLFSYTDISIFALTHVADTVMKPKPIPLHSLIK